MRPTAAMAPMTIPAMAPPERVEEDEAGVGDGVGDVVGAVDAAAEVADGDWDAVVVTAVEVGVVAVEEVDGKMTLTDSGGMGKTSKAGRSREASWRQTLPSQA